jgi:hypothetical protein
MVVVSIVIVEKKKRQDEIQIITKFNVIWVSSYLRSMFKCNFLIFYFESHPFNDQT